MLFLCHSTERRNRHSRPLVIHWRSHVDIRVLHHCGCGPHRLQDRGRHAQFCRRLFVQCRWQPHYHRCECATALQFKSLASGLPVHTHAHTLTHTHALTHTFTHAHAHPLFFFAPSDFSCQASKTLQAATSLPLARYKGLAKPNQPHQPPFLLSPVSKRKVPHTCSCCYCFGCGFLLRSSCAG